MKLFVTHLEHIESLGQNLCACPLSSLYIALLACFFKISFCDVNVSGIWKKLGPLFTSGIYTPIQPLTSLTDKCWYFRLVCLLYKLLMTLGDTVGPIWMAKKDFFCHVTAVVAQCDPC